MARAPAVHPATELARRLEAFVIERYPFAVAPVRAAFDACKGRSGPTKRRSTRCARPSQPRSAAGCRTWLPTERLETTPGVEAPERFQLCD